ncbi:MnhB domain-containing protein [Litorihabitans aurantiacus]|uniref:Na+/H+ antiporter MnhB subunit-related protein domain-containing protein n=1 Tax=Litorihabitans aurantiacus TaxID=1930061 RepID=A0AA37XI50_9MICO|nr:MnhB domain-containing protein [Litorihabitans aurantiacus]GMA32990.1 hypothetical protein GCM10025875_29820 [Litorihabitans aurantiacus]
MATGVGLVGLVEGSFLTPMSVDLLGLYVTSALVFDVGVYLAVIGVVLAALNLLGLPRSGPPSAVAATRFRRAPETGPETEPETEPVPDAEPRTAKEVAP